MAILIESTIISDFIKDDLFPRLNAYIQGLEDCFGYDELCVPIVLAVYFPPVSGQVFDTVVEGSSDLLNIG